jgi:hypothetical protein
VRVRTGKQVDIYLNTTRDQFSPYSGPSHGSVVIARAKQKVTLSVLRNPINGAVTEPKGMNETD